MQSRRDSLIEANVNTWLGLIGSLVITMACNYVFLPLVGIWWASTITVGACTVWSLIRGYYVRRFFNFRQTTAAVQYKNLNSKEWREDHPSPPLRSRPSVLPVGNASHSAYDRSHTPGRSEDHSSST